MEKSLGRSGVDSIAALCPVQLARLVSRNQRIDTSASQIGACIYYMGRPLTRARRFGMVKINLYDPFYVEIVLPSSILALGCDRYWGSTSDCRDWAGSSNANKDRGFQAGAVRAHSWIPIVEVPT